MGVMPLDKVGKIQFCEGHITPFTSNAVAIGTTVAACTDLATKTTAARAALNAQIAAKQAFRAATGDLDMAIETMVNAAADIVKQVRARAATGGDGIYTLAELPIPATPAPKAPPGPPTGLVVTLDGDGTLHLKWKCANPAGASGTIYQVWRRDGGSGAFAYLGGSGKKEFDDPSVPAGTSSVTYQIQGVRSTAMGPWTQFNVNFGVGGGGGPLIASVVQAPGQGGPTSQAA